MSRRSVWLIAALAPVVLGPASSEAAGGPSPAVSAARALLQEPLVAPHVQVTSWSAQGPAGGSDHLAGIAVARNGDVYAVDPDSHRVLRFGRDGRFLGNWGSLGTREGQFNFRTGDSRIAPIALGIAAADAGSIYVGDLANHRVQRFAPDGTFLASWGRYGAGAGQFKWPVDVAVARDSTVYVADAGNTRVQRFDRHGRYLGEWSVRGACGSGYSRLVGLAVSADGTVSVADGNGVAPCIQRYDPGGDLVATWPVDVLSGGSSSSIRGPFGLAAGPDGSVFATGWNTERQVLHFSSSGDLLAAWDASAEGERRTYPLMGIAVDGASTVYVTLLTEIRTFDSAGRSTGAIHSRAGQAYGALSRPLGMTTGPDGTIYVADSGNRRLQRFTAAGRFVGQYGPHGDGAGPLALPADVAVAADGAVYVADAGSDSIHSFSLHGDPTAQWGGHGSSPGQFDQPSGVAVAANGTVYVSDTGNNRVQAFTADGQFLRQWGAKGSELGQLNAPQGLAVDPDGALRVVDAGNFRVQVFSPFGDPLYILGFFGGGDGQFRAGTDVAVRPDGATFATDAINSRVQRFDPFGRTLMGWGGVGTRLGLLSAPSGVAVGPDDSVCISDTGNNRIQCFESRGGQSALWSSTAWSDVPEAEFRWSSRLATASDGTILIADDYPGRRVQMFTPAGEFIRQWSLYDRTEGQSHGVDGFAVGPGDTLYVLELFNRIVRINRYTMDGQYTGGWPLEGLGRPAAIAVGLDGSVYVTNTRGRPHVRRYDAAGVTLSEWDISGVSSGPSAVAVGPAGDVYTARGVTVHRSGPDGEARGSWGSWGRGEGQFGGECRGCRIGGLVVGRDGSVYVGDWGNQRIQRFDRSGAFLTAFGPEYNTEVGPWTFPGSFTIGADGTAYVLETTGQRLFVYGPELVPNWQASYYANRWLAQRPLAARAEPRIGFDWGLNPPEPLLPRDGFSARYERLTPLAPGAYSVLVTATGGVRMWVDETLVIDEWVRTKVNRAFDLVSNGRPRRLVVEYNDPGGPASLYVELASP